ncbi:uncharacterized protein LOC105425956 [Pogonomyrmex barbatus]|uniref:Uncharacterized protein LOC105425956 n=1 Tax=Pogonomyrmex barbatus TaxID=144034 RepID=A0A6I9W591_9HYME|nr:uncharacterized protein LOC105425956 [Pogonomyrmex barbatus]
MMLRVICPKCHHRFPVLGCCLKGSNGTKQKKMKEKEEEEEKENEIKRDDKKEEDKKKKKNEIKEEEEEEERGKEKRKMANSVCSTTTTYYVSGLPAPCNCISDSDCFINSSTITHESTVLRSHTTNCGSNVKIISSDIMELPYDIQMSSMKQSHHPLLKSPICQLNDQDSLIAVTENINYKMTPSQQYVATTRELTGGSVTITTPDIQSGGCLIQNTETEILVQASQIKIQPKLTGGGCLVQKKELSTEDERLTTSKHMKDFMLVNNDVYQTFVTPPSGSFELSKNIKTLPSETIKDDENNEIMNLRSRQQKIPNVIKTNDCCNCKNAFQQNHCQYHRQPFDASLTNNRDSVLLEPVGNSVQIQVNATVQLPASLGQCTVNITATTTTPPKKIVAMKLPSHGRNNFHGGGIVQPNDLNCTMENQTVATESSKHYTNIEQRDETLTAPVPCLMPTLRNQDSDINKLREIKRLLQICGWYHEGISWQQSENLLKNSSVGRWLMRDSSDSRYTFAISVQTSRGPASIRVHYFLGRFRLDAEPSLALAMPFFDNPIRMLEHYIEYSKKMDEHRREVWVDYNGQLYSQIYLTNPILKEVRSLSHLARLAVNRSKLSTERLPLLIKNYIEEYPYIL